MHTNPLYNTGKYIALFLLAFLFSFSCKKHETTVVDAEVLKKNLDELALDLMVPGFSVYIGQGDIMEWTGSFNHPDLKSDAINQDQVCYQCASITKPIAATIVLKMVQEGRISLDDLVLPYILPILQKYGIPIDESVGEMKVKHLLSHTSDSPPGTYFRYDGDRYSLMQLPIEEICGRNLGEIFLTEICQPLEMDYTVPCTLLDSFPLISEKLATPYTLNKDLEIVKGNYTTGFSASAGLISSVGDLAKFTNAYFNGQIIPPHLVELATGPYVLKSGARSTYGLGWYVEELFGMKTVWHAAYGYSTSGLLLYIPEIDLSFIMLSNSNLLSRPFPNGLPEMSLLESPFALEVFRMILKNENNDDDPPVIDWDAQSEEEVISKYEAAGKNAKHFIRMEIKGRWNIARILGDHVKQEKLYSIYRRMDRVMEANEDHFAKHLAQIYVSGKGHFTDTLELQEDGMLEINAVADGGYCEYFGMYDQVWIESISGNIVWKMNAPHTGFAGGHPRNRKASLKLIFPKGEYVVHFSNIDSPYNHYYGHWQAFPPNDNMLGIILSIQENKE